MASVTSSHSKSVSQSSPYLLDIPDDDTQRGRKRRRSSAGHVTSNGSTTLRGRGRHRSPSLIGPDVPETQDERPRSKSLERKSPGKKYRKKLLKGERGAGKEKGRRSQSLSRSRSRGKDGVDCGLAKPRRRQRTRTRSRSHRGEGRDKVGGVKGEDGESGERDGESGSEASEVAVED